jgi:WD40 repeat protein
VASLAYSPTGRLLASAGEDGTAKLWDVATARCIRTIKVGAKCVSFSPDGALLLTGSGTKLAARGDHAVRFWSVRSGRLVRSLQGARAPVESIDWSPDGRMLAAASADGPVRVWRADTWRQIGMLQEAFPDIGKGDSVGASEVRFSPNGRTLAVVSVASYSGVPGHMLSKVVLWDWRTRKRERTLPDDPNRWRAAVAFSPTGNTLAVATAGVALEGDVIMWDAASGRQRILAHQLEGGYGIAFLNRGRWVAAGGDWAQVRLLDAENGKVIAVLPHAATVGAMAAAPDGKALATDNGDGRILVWNIGGLATRTALRRKQAFIDRTPDVTR